MASPDCSYLKPGQSLAIPVDGSWLSVCFTDVDAPANGVVARVSVKYTVDHPDLTKLEVRLARQDTSIMQPLWTRGTPAVGTEPGRAPGLVAFNGLSANGEWRLELRNTTGDLAGLLRTAEVLVDYAPTGPALKQMAESPGQVAAAHLVTPQIVTPDSLGSLPHIASSAKVRASRSVGGLRAPETGDWQTLKLEGYEDGFPNYDTYPFAYTYWSRSGSTIDPDGNPRQYLWGADTSWYHSGGHAAWPAREGNDALNPLWSGYASNMNSWMSYGPLDLRAAVNAQVAWYMWNDTETNFDYAKFQVYNGDTHTTSSALRWDGYHDWQQITVDLTPFIGYNNIYLYWGFTSDSSVEQQGTWVDDIGLWLLPGHVTVSGDLSYYERDNSLVRAGHVDIALWAYSSNDWSFLGETITSATTGQFSFPAVLNWNPDPGAADPDPRLDLEVVWYSSSGASPGGLRQVESAWDLGLYQWGTNLNDHLDVPNGTLNLAGTKIASSESSRRAMWILQDMNRAHDYVVGHTSPSVEPGASLAIWASGVTGFNPCVSGSCFWAGVGGPWIFIDDNLVVSRSTAPHETGHQYMNTATSYWNASWNCWGHTMWSVTDPGCAWSEGWGDFFSLAVNNSSCYDYTNVVCSGDNLETHSVITDDCSNPNNPFHCGITVEGRVAGALWDFYDSVNDGYDQTQYPFSQIWTNMVVPGGHADLSHYWSSWMGRGYETHLAVQAIYQNTIDLDQSPLWNISAVGVGRGGSYTFNVESYVTDVESYPWIGATDHLAFQNPANLNGACTVTFSNGNRTLLIHAPSDPNFTGPCQASVQAFDGLWPHTTTGTFTLNVYPVSLFLPFIAK